MSLVMPEVRPEEKPKAVRHKPKSAHVWRRDELDWYVEPEWATELLLEAEQFEGAVLDPACGSGNVCRACARAGLFAVGTDIVKRPGMPTHQWIATQDFLEIPAPWWITSMCNIITNPPFFRAKGTEAFARRALMVAEHKVAIFTCLPFLASRRRAAGLFAEFPPARVWILAERPSCPPGEYLLAGNEAKGGTEDWCWLVWDKDLDGGETRLGWLRGKP